MNNKTSVFGSSYARSFENLFPNTFVFQASTAKGLNNPNSQSKVNKKICSKLNSLQKSSNVIFFLATVDLNFVTNYKYNLIDNFNCEKYIIKSVNHYINFIKNNIKHLNVFICEAPISHITDENLIKILKVYENQRDNSWIESKITKVIPYEIRNKHILLFNKELEKLSDINGFKLLKINKYFKNSAGDFKIPSKYIRKNKLDHHLKNNIVELYLKSLKTL
tara:strand:- start:19523 stop:20185 length:663 start_codon:yes stop_codon:yes gene_type:complete